MKTDTPSTTVHLGQDEERGTWFGTVRIAQTGRRVRSRTRAECYRVLDAEMGEWHRGWRGTSVIGAEGTHQPRGSTTFQNGILNSLPTVKPRDRCETPQNSIGCSNSSLRQSAGEEKIVISIIARPLSHPKSHTQRQAKGRTSVAEQDLRRFPSGGAK